VEFKHSDGSGGWEGKGPFDAIITTAAPQQIPQELLAQLADGGRLVIPVGVENHQELRLIVRQGKEFITEILDLVRFVPLLVGQVHH
jgi:protein-L-isoaspartate(D-aspartate) O-methyltransferase